MVYQPMLQSLMFNTLRPRQDGRHFPDDIFKCIFFNENVLITIKISLTFVPKGPINDIPTLVQIMAWRRPGEKPLSEPMLVSLPTHICVTRPQLVNSCISYELQMKCSFVSYHPYYWLYLMRSEPNSGTFPWWSGTVTWWSKITPLE